VSRSFGKFKLIQRIGGGRLSEVYRVGNAWSPTAPKIVLKRVSPELIGERSFVQLVAREAGLLSRLEHENLCICQEMGVIDGCAFLTLDLIDGCTLRALMRRLSKMRIRLPASAVMAIAHQAADVLDYLHRHCPTPLIHLDLSPQNVMISRSGELKLIDFGIARFIDGHNPPPLGGRIAGTVGYMSPEQAQGKKQLDARADQYALGILLWELLTGQRLFHGNTSETWRRMRDGDVLDVSLVASGASPELAALIGRMLRADESERFATMGALKNALENLYGAPRSGMRPLAALTTRLMGESDFDPFDTIRPSKDKPATTSAPVNIPTGDVELPVDGYADLKISVDHHGDGTPSAQMRAVVPETASGDALDAESEKKDKRQPAPDSPFLEPDSYAS
jgi:serine/threonine protein kinase